MLAPDTILDRLRASEGADQVSPEAYANAARAALLVTHRDILVDHYADQIERMREEGLCRCTKEGSGR